MHLPNWESAENCYIMHLSIKQKCKIYLISVILCSCPIAIFCTCPFGQVQNIAFIVIFCTCPIGKVQKIPILCTCPFVQVQNIVFIVIFCTCPIMKVQKFAILCTCLFGKVQNIAFSHFLQLSNWGSAENSYIMHQAIWENIHISVTGFLYCRSTWYYMKLIHK